MYSEGYGQYADERADSHAKERKQREEEQKERSNPDVEVEEEGRLVGGNVFRSIDPTTSVEEAYGLAALALGRAEDGWSGVNVAVREAAKACSSEIEALQVTAEEMAATRAAAEKSASRFEDQDTQMKFALKSVRASLKSLPAEREKASLAAADAVSGLGAAEATAAAAQGTCVNAGGWRPASKLKKKDGESGGSSKEDDPDTSSTSDLVFPLSELVMSNMLPDESQEKWRAMGVDIRRRQDFLGDRAFERVFGMSKDEFYKLAEWKQLSLKKKHDLF